MEQECSFRVEHQLVYIDKRREGKTKFLVYTCACHAVRLEFEPKHTPEWEGAEPVNIRVIEVRPERDRNRVACTSEDAPNLILYPTEATLATLKAWGRRSHGDALSPVADTQRIAKPKRTGYSWKRSKQPRKGRRAK